LRRAAGFAAVAGAVAVLGFAPFGWHPLPILSLAVLFELWHRHPSPREAAWIGAAWGAGHFLAGVSWVYVSLHTFGMMPAPLAAIATIGFCGVLSGFPALAGWLVARWPTHAPIRALLVFPGAWTFTEWARSWFLTGFPWLTTGYSQIDAPVGGYAALAGVFGISWLAAMTAGALWALFRTRARWKAVAASLAVLIHVGGIALGNHAWTTRQGEGFDAALLQGNIPQELKFVPGRFEATLATYARLVAQTNAHLIVLPETAIPRFPDEVPRPFIERILEHARAHGANVLLGLPTGDPRAQYHNSMVSLGVDDSQHYSKSHLVPFGEFIPPGFGWIERVLSVPLSSFTPGPVTQRPLQLGRERVAINICYEDAFGSEIIRQLPEATVLVNASNVAWFGDSLAPAQHLEIARMRARETGRFMLRSTNTGVTAIIDQRGRVLAALPAFEEGVLTGRVQGHAGATPYVKVGDAIVGLAVVLVLAGFAFGRERIRRA